MKLKELTFLLTILNYLFLHCLRTAYSFLKPQFRKFFHFSNQILANIDSAIYLGIGVGFASHFLLTSETKIMSYYLRYTILACCFYLIMPIIAIFGFGINNDSSLITKTPSYIQALILVCMFFLGFSQLCIWPTIFALVNDFYKIEKEGGMLGIWAAGGDIGNLVGYFIPTILVVNFHVPWTIPMFIFVFTLIIVSLLVWYFLRKKTKQEKEQEMQFSLEYTDDQIYEEQSDISCCKFTQFFANVTKNTGTVLFISTLCLFKAILYSFLLWIPTYVRSLGYLQISGYVPMLFNVGTIIGSSLIGILYEKKPNEAAQQPFHLKKYFLFYLSFVVIISIALIIKLNGNILIFIMLVVIAGFAIGGIYNSLLCNQLKLIADNRPSLVKMMVIINLSLANITTGVVQFLIGLMIGEQTANTSDVYDPIFYVLLGVAFVATILIFIRLLISPSSKQKLLEQKNEVSNTLQIKKSNVHDE